MTTEAAIEDVTAERQRQIEVEGWSPEHDDQHIHGEIARAASAYALHAGLHDAVRQYDFPQGDPPYPWPWAAEWWKPTDRRRDLVKAAALIIAEIERLDRA